MRDLENEDMPRVQSRDCGWRTRSDEIEIGFPEWEEHHSGNSTRTTDQSSMDDGIYVDCTPQLVAAGAVIVWLGGLVGGMQHEFDSWRFRRTVRRSAELRTRIVSRRKTDRT